MKTSNLIFYKSFIFIIIVQFLGCTPNTTITASWVNPDTTNVTYDNILVTALVDNVSARQQLENNISRKLSDLGIEVSKSIDVFPPKLKDKDNYEEYVVSAIDEYQYEGIITITLVEEKTETRHRPGSQVYMPTSNFGYYGNFRGYYNTRFVEVYNTNYYASSKTYFIETNLYDSETEELIWSAQSETVNSGTMDDFSGKFAQKMINEMKKEQLLRIN